MSTIKVTHTVRLRAPVKEVWPLISNTDRINRLIGMAPVKYRPIDATSGPARFLGETRMGGVSVVYEEEPYEWSFGRSYAVTRRFRGGPFAKVRLLVTLEPSEGDSGTTLSATLEVEPRNALGRPLAWIGGRKAVRAIAGTGEKLDAYLGAQADHPFSLPVVPSDPTALSRARGRLAEQEVPAELVDRLVTFVRDCADADAIRIRPFELADAWGRPRREVLAAFLKAVSAGLVELRWAIVCPSCRTASEEVPRLLDISVTGHCQLCDIAFELDLDRAVEATFHPHPTIRKVPEMFFCMGGPGRTPHVLSQVALAPGETRALPAPDEAGRYRLFGRGGAKASVEVEPGAPAEVHARLSAEALEPAELRISPGGSLLVESRAPDSRHVKLERLEYASAAATAHLISTLPEFRDLFSGELLKRETPLKVARVAIFFSDLTGSTALYTEVGDAAAFRLVDDHFDVIRRAIVRHDGVVVKTMGDAVMASFLDERSCALAAIDCLRDFETFRASVPHGERTHLKLGIYSGPCYVVTANGALDYFGQTVNVASRLQHLAGSGELVMLSEAAALLAEDPRVVLGAPFRASVKGVPEPLLLSRVTLAPARLRAAAGS